MAPGQRDDGEHPPVSYPQPKPNLAVRLIRLPWLGFLVLAGMWVALAVYLMLHEGWWYVVPIVLLFGYFTYVLFRNRGRRARTR
jgi:hypothetical protein